MQYLTALFLGLAVTATATNSKRQSDNGDNYGDDIDQQEGDYISSVCSPSNATGYPDMSAPCNQLYVIQTECVYGAAGLAAFTGDDSDDNGSYDSYGEYSTPTLDNSTQRTCICESQYWNVFNGCNDCFAKHGAPSIVDSEDGSFVPQSIIDPVSSSYCAATNTPTLGFADVLYAVATSIIPSSVSSTTTATSSFSDPVGNNTAVSLYFTPSVTGSSAWVVAQATITPSNNTVTSSTGSASSPSLNTDSAGQIVPTAGATTSNGGASGTASGSSTASATGSSGASRQEAAALAGVIAFAAFAAAL